MNGVPRIIRVEASAALELRVVFQGGVEKFYDCRPLLARPEFFLLRDPAFFRSVQLEPGGYGVSWSERIDLSEWELWVNGREVPLNTSAGRTTNDPSVA